MVIGEILLSAIADAVFGYLTDKEGASLEDWAREKLGSDPTKKAFKRALAEAFEAFKQQYPEWVAANFDVSFFAHEGAPILAQFLLRNGHPDPCALAACWADSLNLPHSERRAVYTRELEPIAADFLELLSKRLKSKPALRELQDSRTFEQLRDDLAAIRQCLGAEKATPGTRRDYLRWIMNRNLYLDPRGTFQTQRQVQLKLDYVYVSLKAHRAERFGEADRDLLEKELIALEASLTTRKMAAEEIEDQRERVLLRFERQARLIASKADEVLELAACVQQHDRLVILGDPGSGKTTLLRYLALQHACALWNQQTEANPDLGHARFPLLVRIADYAEDGRWKQMPLSDFLTTSYMLHECPAQGLADLLRTEMEQGECLILLDGLDEIVSADERRGVVERIEDFVRRYGPRANRFVITSRIAGYRSAPLGEPFAHYTVQDMDETQICHFLERWCQAVEDAETPELPLQERERVARREIEGIMKAVQNSPGVRRLAANPLLVRTIALIHRTGAQLPQKRIELYKFAADVLARTWRTAQGVPESALVIEEYLTPLLATLAYWLHAQKPTGIATEREVYAVLGEEWAHLHDLPWNPDDPSPKITEEVKKFLAAVREHTGLFVERAPRRYSFLHLTFEEYYVARYLVASSRTRAKLIRQHLHDPRWQEPILLALGFVGLDYREEASELVETAILAQGEEARAPGFTPSKYEEKRPQRSVHHVRFLRTICARRIVSSFSRL
jgi:hypothetical protein